MSLSDEIAGHLPFLRRYARALTGSQKSGDAYVAAALEAIVNDPEILQNGHDGTRVALYRLFTSLWQTLDVNMESEEVEALSQAQADRRLEAITPRPRQAFLLMSLEEFSVEQTALILGVSSEEASRLIDEAGEELAGQVSTDVLIIEDEPLIAMDIEHIIKGLGHNVTGIARTHAEALQAVGDKRPGLVLADIQLADGSSGLDAVNDMLAGFEVPVVFITAFPERLLTGERPEPAFLITKPFQPDSLKAIVSQVLFFNAKSGSGHVWA